MVIIRLWGGIGNQLFQYTFGEYLRNKMHQDVRYDIGSFGKSDKLRTFELYVLNNDLPIVDDISFSKCTGIVNRFLLQLFKLSKKNRFVTKWDDDALSFEENKKYYFQGYWLDRKYAKELLNIQKDLYVPKKQLPSKLDTVFDLIQKETVPVAIHIRRGDYFSPKNIDILGVCDPDYFHKAIALLKKKLLSSFRLFVFSDDLDWVKENLNLPDNSVFVPNYDIAQFWYIHLMSLCKHNIISNSTFSWWGAMLNKNTWKIVIIPDSWVLKKDTEKYNSLYDENWIRI